MARKGPVANRRWGEQNYDEGNSGRMSVALQENNRKAGYEQN